MARNVSNMLSFGDKVALNPLTKQKKGGMSRNLSTLAFAAIISCAVISANPASADVTPTLDKLHAQDPVAHPETSAYTLTPTEETSGTGVYDIPEYDVSTQTLIHNYYKLNTKIGVVTETRMVNTTDNSATNYSGHYIGQNTTSTTATVSGGAIYNNGASAKLGNITGDFINNYASTTGSSKSAYGGAIFNSGTLGDITGDFIGNSIASNSNVAQGGAIYNNGASAQIGDITGNFTGNSANSTNSYAYGGAIYNTKTIGDIIGSFSGNSATSATSYAVGGAIFNRGTITNITGSFTDNYAMGDIVMGGAIFSSGTIAAIGDVTSTFYGNYIKGNGFAIGGAIDNQNGTIGSIVADFTGNYAESENSYAVGGAIFSCGTINSITGNFSGNHTKAENNAAYGGAVYNEVNTINDITGNFFKNHAEGFYTLGGAIGNTGTINNIKGNFIGNHIDATVFAVGGAIYNNEESTIGKIGNITGDFINNSATASSNDSENVLGGAIYNNQTIDNIRGNFIGNYAKSENREVYGGAIYNTGAINGISGDFLNNYAKSGSDNYLALGGAIFQDGDGNNLNLIADNRTITFSGNYTEDYRGKINNAIFVKTSTATAVKDGGGVIIGYDYTYITPKVTLNATNNGQFILNDNIDGGEIIYDDIHDGTHHGTHLERTHQYDLAITGDSTGKVYLNNDILNANITHDNVTTNVSDWRYLSHAAGEGINSLTMNSGTLNIPSLTTEPLLLNQFNMLGGTINIGSIDVDLENKQMGRFLANTYSGGGGTINVNGLNVKTSSELLVTDVPFADTSFADSVKYNGSKTVASPVYMYDVSYLGSGSSAGSFRFTRSSNAFNPAVLTAPVTTQAAAVSTLNHTFEYAFEHSDRFMNLSENKRFSMLNSNKLALSTDFNENTGRIDLEENKAIWVKPYTAFESIPLRHGPRVDAISYGTLIGGDSNMRELKHGWSNVGTAYVGYNGSTLEYSNVNTTTNGGVAGLTETFYKGNLFTALTATVGAGTSEIHTGYGKEDSTFLMTGVASKTGYNFEFKEGKLIVQPLFVANYTAVKMFDYTNAAHVRIKSDMAHNLQLAPTLKVIGNLDGGWQPYATVGMVWNVLHESNVTADGARLPEMYTKPYVQYGVGLQRNWRDNLTAYGQAMVRNGGRRGIMLTFGFRWALGRDNKKIEKVQNYENTAKKVLKASK